MSERNTAHRGWMITASAADYTRDDIMSALGGFDGVIGQLERGGQVNSETGQGYLHWQLYVEHDAKIRFNRLKKLLPKAHIEPRRGSKRQAIAYVTKRDTRVDSEEQISIGEIKVGNQVQSGDLETIRDAVMAGESVDDVLERYPESGSHIQYADRLRSTFLRKQARQREIEQRKIQVDYVYGAAGSGKTTWALRQSDDFFRVTDYQHPFDFYDGEDVLILDEFAGQIGITKFNVLCEPFQTVLPARYADKFAVYSRLIVVSNLPPWEAWRNFPIVDDEVRRAVFRRIDRLLKFDYSGRIVPVTRSEALKGFGFQELPSASELAISAR